MGQKFCLCRGKYLVDGFVTVGNPKMTNALPYTKGKDFSDGIVYCYVTAVHVS